MSIRRRGGEWRLWIGGALLLPVLLAVATLRGMAGASKVSLEVTTLEQAAPVFEDRNGIPLNRTYQTHLNVYDRAALHEIPQRLIDAFILAEDARFFRHHGIDWLARLHALWQNARALQKVRGASTITEQVVRIVHPRPRTYWSRWLEGWEAVRLERRYGKQDILEFYLNQVPFSSGRRGVVQAARHYFGRSLDTLNTREMLALATMVRAPSLLDPYNRQGELEKRVAVLADRMRQAGIISPRTFEEVGRRPLKLHPPEFTAEARDFLAYVREQLDGRAGWSSRVIRTTLDAELQQKVNSLLEQRLREVAGIGIRNGGVVVVDHSSGEVLAWAVAGKGGGQAVSGSYYDAVRVPRQPGSTLKPFVYALALDKGWTPTTQIKDEPVFDAVENGLHVFRNFSKTYYGMVTLAEALGNSLNTPAVRALEFVGQETFITTLQKLGIESLSKGAEVYGNGIVLGNAEISLMELVKAYGSLARGGRSFGLKVVGEEPDVACHNQNLISEQSAETIGAILSEERFRRLEFGRQSVLSFPERTAVKTGTSAAGRDIWTMAYNGRFLVGIWFGNMDRSSPAKMITGAGGPALLARSIFNEVRRRYGMFPLPGGAVLPSSASAPGRTSSVIRMAVPTEGMEVLFDARIPASSQCVPFLLTGLADGDWVEWTVDGKRCDKSHSEKLSWPVVPGVHLVSARITRSSGETVTLPNRRFVVK